MRSTSPGDTRVSAAACALQDFAFQIHYGPNRIEATARLRASGLRWFNGGQRLFRFGDG